MDSHVASVVMRVTKVHPTAPTLADFSISSVVNVMAVKILRCAADKAPFFGR